MRKRDVGAILAMLTLVAGILGCGGPEKASTTSARDGSRPRLGSGYGDSSTARAAAKATATEVDYYGWKAFKLTNGLVTVIAVPDVGGRIMEYKLGAHPFIWQNPDELG